MVGVTQRAGLEDVQVVPRPSQFLRDGVLPEIDRKAHDGDSALVSAASEARIFSDRYAHGLGVTSANRFDEDFHVHAVVPLAV
jgi:hypothetical protein